MVGSQRARSNVGTRIYVNNKHKCRYKYIYIYIYKVKTNNNIIKRYTTSKLYVYM